MTHQVTRCLGLEYELIHGSESLAPRKREALTPAMVKSLIRAVDGGFKSLYEAWAQFNAILG